MSVDGAITVLISGRGSNLKALIQHQSGYRVAHVISDKSNAGGLTIARDAGIPTTVVERESFSSLADFKTGVLKAAQSTEPKLVALAGFMVVLQPAFIEAFAGRLVNIHPSLLPSFPGLHTHERAIESKATRHGCTVHYVDTGVDTGPLIAQASLHVLPNDTPDTLSARVLAREHFIYPWVVSRIVSGDIALEGRTVRHSPRAVREAAENDISLYSK